MLTQIEKVAYAGLLLAEAFGRWGTVDLTPPAVCPTFHDAVTECHGKVFLWYNTPDDSTHIESMERIKV
jgi:hypothetical protein